MNHSSQLTPLRLRTDVCKISSPGQAGAWQVPAIRHWRSKRPLSSGLPSFLTAVLAADRNIHYSRENRFRALMARSQGSRANIQLQCRPFKASGADIALRKNTSNWWDCRIERAPHVFRSFVVMAERHGQIVSVVGARARSDRRPRRTNRNRASVRFHHRNRCRRRRGPGNRRVGDRPIRQASRKI
jgi:hypothetical protein